MICSVMVAVVPSPPRSRVRPTPFVSVVTTARSIRREAVTCPTYSSIITALRITAIGSLSVLQEWEPYAGMLAQGKPAELVYIPEGSHVLVKPWERLTSQQGAVDWDRFWLQGYEDPDPAKADQYARWRRLRTQRDSTTASSSH